jgi:putative lipoprotein (rSAM/lipoprotein system)
MAVLKAVAAATTAVLGPLCCFDTAEYGMPSAEYRVSGTIRSAATGASIAGIAVTLTDSTDPPPPPAIDVDTTDAAGAYMVSFRTYPFDTIAVRMSASDEDGAENGLYQHKDTILFFPRSALSGGDGDWYEGSVEKVVELRLDEDVIQ